MVVVDVVAASPRLVLTTSALRKRLGDPLAFSVASPSSAVVITSAPCVGMGFTVIASTAAPGYVLAEQESVFV